jgi:hypothetical protein
MKIDLKSDQDELAAQEELSNRIQKFLSDKDHTDTEQPDDPISTQPIDSLPDVFRPTPNNQESITDETTQPENTEEEMEKRVIALLAQQLRTQVEHLAAIKKLQEEADALMTSQLDTPTKQPIQPDDAPNSNPSLKESHDGKISQVGEDLIKKLHSKTDSINKLKGLNVESKQEFDEFFNVNLDKEQVSDEYEDTFRKIVASPEFLSFAINEEYILVLRPQMAVHQKKAKIFSSTRILKTKILEYLNIFDVLKLRLTCNQFKDIVKSTWHVVHKREMYNMALHGTTNRYVS